MYIFNLYVVTLNPIYLVCIFTCMYVNCSLQWTTQAYNLLPYTRSWFVHCCTDQHSHENKYNTSLMEGVPDDSCAIELNMGCHSHNRILLLSVLPTYQSYTRATNTRTSANHIHMGRYLSDLHQGYMFPSTSL